MAQKSTTAATKLRNLRKAIRELQRWSIDWSDETDGPDPDGNYVQWDDVCAALNPPRKKQRRRN